MHTLNHCYRLVWNHAHNCWQAVGELAKSQTKTSGVKAAPKLKAHRLLRRLTLAAALSVAAGSYAAPQNGQIQQGQGQISQSGLTTTIQQQSQRLDIGWQSFNVGQQESVNFVQPGRNALAVNHILDTNGSRIQGQINANGQVWLINPNGVIFGQHSRVNVGGLVASTLQEQSNQDGEVVFGQSLNQGTGRISNLGNIQTSAGGYVAFIGEQVSNHGEISSPGGSVALGAGSQVSLNFADSQLLGINIDQSTLDNLADNQGLIQAEGGQVLMSAGARDSLLASVVNNDGVITANSVVDKDGTIMLLAGMAAGSTQVSGSLDASAKADSEAQGGFIETSGHKVTVSPDSHITTYAANGATGTWLIDPTDYTIAASGGDITGSQLSINLAQNNVEIQSDNGANGSNGDIFVNDAVSWNAANTLTLTAKGNIHVNQTITAESNGGKVVLNYGQANVASGNSAQYYLKAAINLKAGDNFSTALGNDGAAINYTVITELGAEGSTTGTDLQGMSGNLGGNYVLGVDIDAAATAGWAGGFAPVGALGVQVDDGTGRLIDDGSAVFYGRLDGLGHTVNNLAIDRPDEINVGLIGFMGRYLNTGDAATVANLHIEGASIRGKNSVGGLAGRIKWGEISGSSFTGSVTGTLVVGGLVGVVGEDSTVSNSYTSGMVVGGDRAGGLAGRSFFGSTIKNSYATAAVSGGQQVGGLVGLIRGAVQNSYATGAVTGTSMVGGLVGRIFEFSTIDNSYATGLVTVDNGKPAGGLVGEKLSGTVTNSFWDTETTGRSTSAAGIGKTTAELMQLSTFSGWDIDNAGGTGKVWRIYEGSTRPLLRSFLTPKNLKVEVIYDGADHIYTLPTGDDLILGGVVTSGAAHQDTGDYRSETGWSSLYSTQLGYDFIDAGLVIAQRVISLSGSRVYDSTNNFAIASLNAASGDLVSGDSLSAILSGNGRTAQVGVRDNYVLSTANLTLNNNNYTLVGGTHQASITPRVLTLSGSREYDGSDVFNFESLQVDNLINGDVLNGNFSVASADAGDYLIDALSLGNTNYTVEGAGSSVSILPRSITLSGSRVYDGSAVFELQDFTVVNLIDGESLLGAVSVEASDVGTYSAEGLALGAANANYQLLSGALNITPRSVTVTGSKQYDGNTVFVGDSVTFVNLIDGDDLGLSLNASRGDVGNYSANSIAVVNANYSLDNASALSITAKSLNITGSRAYDSSTGIDAANLVLSDVVAGESVTIAGSAVIASKDVGQYVLPIQGLSLNDDNYTLDGGVHSVTINPVTIQVQATALDKTFDGSLDAEIGTVNSSDVFSGDNVQLAFLTAQFAVDEGEDIPVSVEGITLSGTDAGNYILSSESATATASIRRPQDQGVDDITNSLQNGDAQVAANEVNVTAAADTTIDFANLDATAAGGPVCSNYAAGGNQANEYDENWADSMGGVAISDGGVSLGDSCAAENESDDGGR